MRNKRSACYNNVHNLQVLSKINHNKSCTGNTKIIKEKNYIKKEILNNKKL